MSFVDDHQSKLSFDSLKCNTHVPMFVIIFFSCTKCNILPFTTFNWNEVTMLPIRKFFHFFFVWRTTTACCGTFTRKYWINKPTHSLTHSFTHLTNMLFNLNLLYSLERDMVEDSIINFFYFGWSHFSLSRGLSDIALRHPSNQFIYYAITETNHQVTDTIHNLFHYFTVFTVCIFRKFYISVVLKLFCVITHFCIYFFVQFMIHQGGSWLSLKVTVLSQLSW